MCIYTITEKGYVERDGKKLIPTALGTTINDLLEEQFKDIVNVKFSAEMESNLDKIEEGSKEWTQVLREFYDGFKNDLEKAQENMEGKKVKVPDEVTDEVCDICGKPMVVKSGKFGKFLACSGFHTEIPADIHKLVWQHSIPQYRMEIPLLFFHQFHKLHIQEFFPYKKARPVL